MSIKLVKINQQSIKNFFYANIYQLFELNLFHLFLLLVIKPNLKLFTLDIYSEFIIHKNTKIVSI